MAMPESDTCDGELPVIEAIRAGDRHALAELVSRHARWTRGVVFGVLGDSDAVDDVTQQVWTAVWQRIGELRDLRRWRPWLYRLARNAAIDYGRDASRRRRRIGRASVDSEAPASACTPDGQAVRTERLRSVMDAIAALPALYREPFVLRHLDHWSYAQIADVMGMPVDSVETRLVRARRLLREQLADRV